MTTKAAAYALAVAAWKRTATEDEKIDGTGEPAALELRRDGLVVADITDDGEMGIPHTVWTPRHALALRDFITEHFEEGAR